MLQLDFYAKTTTKIRHCQKIFFLAFFILPSIEFSEFLHGNLNCLLGGGEKEDERIVGTAHMVGNKWGGKPSATCLIYCGAPATATTRTVEHEDTA